MLIVKGKSKLLNYLIIISTVNSRFKKDLILQIHLHKTFFSDDRFLDSLHKSFDSFLNQEFTVLETVRVIRASVQKILVLEKSVRLM